MSEAPIDDPAGAFVAGAPVARKGTAGGPLSGIRFAAKDIYDIAGTVTGCGNPDWARTHQAAERDAWAVAKLLAAGADLVGKTITDELAYSLNGQNHHYGTPANVNAPGRIPGGSSSGSAAATAAGLVDTALGSDTGGSVRIPAAYCGIFGIRPTHGRLPLDGVMPLAPSFDTVGWFARDTATLKRVGEVLFGESSPRSSNTFNGLVIADDAFALLTPGAARHYGPVVDALETYLGPGEHETVAEPEGFANIMLAFRLLQAREIAAQHRAWIEATGPKFGPEIAERFTWALSVTEEDAAGSPVLRAGITDRLHQMLREDRLICLPTAPGIAPRLESTAEELIEHRSRVLGLTALAGLSGLPQVTLPLIAVEDGPLGLSLIGPRDSDLDLLAFADEFVGTRSKMGLPSSS
jgi:amidase